MSIDELARIIAAHPGFDDRLTIDGEPAADHLAKQINAAEKRK